jgi:hypothetical protein
MQFRHGITQRNALQREVIAFENPEIGRLIIIIEVVNAQSRYAVAGTRAMPSFLLICIPVIHLRSIQSRQAIRIIQLKARCTLEIEGKIEVSVIDRAMEPNPNTKRGFGSPSLTLLLSLMTPLPVVFRNLTSPG